MLRRREFEQQLAHFNILCGVAAIVIVEEEEQARRRRRQREGLVNFLSTSDLDVLDFLESFHNSLFLYFLYNNRLHLINSFQCK